MAELWIWTARTTQVPDVTGWDVVATDGEIGKIDKATYENGRGCMVVDTGWWIFGHKRMIPAGVVQSIDTENKKVYVDLSKDAIKRAPDYDDALENDTDFRQSHDDYYAKREQSVSDR